MEKQQPLIETNPHLKDPAQYRKALIVNVASSTAVETGASVESIRKALSGQPTEKPIKNKRLLGR